MAVKISGSKNLLRDNIFTFFLLLVELQSQTIKIYMGTEDEKPTFRHEMETIVKRAAAYTSGAKRCNLCFEEKLCITKARQKNLPKKKSPIKDPRLFRNTDTETILPFQRQVMRGKER